MFPIPGVVAQSGKSAQGCERSVEAGNLSVSVSLLPQRGRFARFIDEGPARKTGKR
jgi:hypothetical protein